VTFYSKYTRALTFQNFSPEILASLCRDAGAWLLVDNAYEFFAYEAEGHPAHSCVEGDFILNTFSFSKSYGMMGWRVGYLAYPPALGEQLFKARILSPYARQSFRRRPRWASWIAAAVRTGFVKW
jgi:aspartate/methionine/tyrosine aminotransferase